MKVLIACEESQEVCKAFRSLGHEAYSCDVQEPSGGHPEWHLPGVRPPVEENKKGGRNVNGVIRGRCPRCGGKIIYSEFYQNARDYTIRKDGKVPKRYVSRSGELSESVAACENGCGAYWEDEDFSIGQDGMFYDNKYTEDGQA